MSDTNRLLDSLEDADLLRESAPVAGRWLDEAAGGERFEVLDPADGSVIATVPDCGTVEVRAAIDAAEAARHPWAARTGKERAAVLRTWADLMIGAADDLGRILSSEMGKPFAEARGEILYGASFVEWFGEEAKRVYGETIPGHQRDKRLFVLRQPIGVVASITPWNFPNAMIARKVAPALAVGCGFVAKPAVETPLSALAMAVLAERAGLPLALFSVLPSTDAAGVGQAFCDSPTVRKITFTGSTAVGRILLGQSADTIKRASMELGGNAPFIVFDDADIDAAVDGAMIAKFRNNGQTCVCANRIYVQDAVHDRFAERLAERVRGLKVGAGHEEGVDVGPLIGAAAMDKVEAHVADALEHGATLETGGRRHDRGSTFYEPTVLTGATDAMLIASEETFGPVAALFRFQDVDDVIRRANDTLFGLAAYFYAADLNRVWRVAEALEYGMVGVNTGLVSTEVAPFGGVKQSGQGREGSRHGIEDYLEMKYVCIGGMHEG